MNKNFKKYTLNFGAPILIIAPITMAVSCGATNENNNLYYNKDSKLVENKTGNNFFNKQESLVQKQHGDINKYLHLAQFVAYKHEVNAAFILQRGSFEFKLFKLNSDLIEIKEKAKPINDKTEANRTKAEKIQLNSYNEQIKELNKNILFLKNKIKHIIDNNVDFSSSSFGLNYPLLLKPLKIINQDQIKVFKDKKAAFISTFATKKEGEANWPEERKTKYDSAASDQDAINYLSSKIISLQSFKKFKFKINEEYTVEQMIWSTVTNNASWSFLNHKTNIAWLHYKDDPSLASVFLSTPNELAKKLNALKPSVKLSNVFFLSSESKNPLSFLPKNTTNADAMQIYINSVIKSKKIIQVQQLIIAATQGDTVDSPYKISASDIQKLLRVIGNSSNGGIKQAMDFITDPKMFIDKDLTSAAFIISSLDDKDKNKMGGLGIKPVISYVQEKAPGLSLGILSSFIGKEDQTLSWTNLKNELNRTVQEKMEDEKLISKGVKWETLPDANLLLTQLIAKLDKKTEKIFGSVFQAWIPRKNNGRLSYSLSDGNGLHLIQTDGKDGKGLHLIKISDFSKHLISKQFGIQLQAMADKKKYISTNITNTFTNLYNKTKILNAIISNSKMVVELKKQLTEYNLTMPIADHLSFNNLKKIISDSLRSEKDNLVFNSLKDKISKWYINELDKKFKGTIKPEDIYSWTEQVTQ